MLKRTVIISIVLLSLVILPACKREKRPAGFPNIYPCKVQVVDGGSPIEGVHISLVAIDSEAGKWNVSGITDGSGTADLMCRSFPGAPLGTFKVLLDKKDPPALVTAPVADPSQVEMKEQVNHIDASFSDPDETPFTITIEKKQKQVPVFDIADGSTK